MVIFAQVEDAADVVAGPVAPVVRIPAEIEDFRPKGERFDDFALDQPAELPEVPVAGAWIYPVTASTISRPWSPALLQPDWKEKRHMAISEACDRCRPWERE